jgi:transcriptional regulator GlxA family with amidase domain
MAAHSLLIVLFDDVQSLDVTGPLEVFTGANTARTARGETEAYTVRTASLGAAPVGTSSGLRLLPEADLRTCSPPDTLIVPGGQGTRDPDPELVEWVRRAAPHTRRTASVCTGAFILGEAGLLSGRRVTTHWNACAALARRFPDAQVDPAPIFLREGGLATSAGVTAGLDLCLALVEDDLGRETALAIARHLVMFLRRPGNQTQFSAQLSAQTARRRPLRELQRWISEHPEADLSVEALAERARLSPRQFARAFRTETGTTPGRYVDRVRLEAARRLLEDGEEAVCAVARACGYGTPEAMRRAFLKALGTGPAEYRRRFRPLHRTG